MGEWYFYRANHVSESSIRVWNSFAPKKPTKSRPWQDLKFFFHPFFRRVYKNIPQPPPCGALFWVDYLYLPLEPTGGNGVPVLLTSRDFSLGLQSLAELGDSVRKPLPEICKKNVFVKVHQITQSLYIYIYIYLFIHLFMYLFTYLFIYLYLYLNTVQMYKYIYISFPMFAVKMTENFWRRHSKSILSKEHVNFDVHSINSTWSVGWPLNSWRKKKFAKKTKTKHLAPENGCRAPKRKLYYSIPTIHFQVQTCC